MIGVWYFKGRVRRLRRLRRVRRVRSGRKGVGFRFIRSPLTVSRFPLSPPERF